MNKFLLILSVFAGCLVNESSSYLPKSIRACPRNTPKLDECIITTVDSLRPLLAAGDFGENFKVPRMEPLELDNIPMKRGNEFTATFSNLLVNGPSNFIIEKLKANANDLYFDFTLLLPKLNFTGNYALKLKILLLDINGKGTMKGYFKNARGVVKARAREVEKNGVKGVQFERLNIKLSIADSKIRLDNLFNGDPVLGRVGNEFINDNTQLFLNEIIPGLEKSLSKKFTDIANSILATTSADEMFPPK